MSLLNLDQVRDFLLDGKNVAELIYNGKTIWRGNTIVLSLESTVEMDDLASGRILMVFPKEVAMQLKAAINSENMTKITLIYPDDTHILISFDLDELIKQIDCISVSKLTLYAININQLISLLLDETSSVAKIKTESTELTDITGVKVTAGIRASLEPPTREIKDLDPILTESIIHSSGCRIVIHGGQSEEEVKTPIKRDSSAVKSLIFSAFTEKTNEIIESDRKSSGVKIKIIHADPEKTEEIVGDASKRLGLRVVIDSFSSRDMVSIDSEQSSLAMGLKMMPQNIRITGDMKYTSTSNISAIYSDEHSIKTKLKIAINNEPNVFIAHPLSISPATKIGFNGILSIGTATIYPKIVSLTNFIKLDDKPSQNVLMVTPNEEHIKINVGMLSRNSVLVELMNANWEYPIIVGNALKVTQVYSTEVNGTKLIIQ